MILIVLMIGWPLWAFATMVRFSDPERAFLLKPTPLLQNSAIQHSNKNNYRLIGSATNNVKTPSPIFKKEFYDDEETSTEEISNLVKSQQPQTTSSHYASFLLLKGGHVGNRVSIDDSGFSSEQRLDHVPSISNATRFSTDAVLVKVLTDTVTRHLPAVRIFVHLMRHQRRLAILPCVTVYALFKDQIIFGQCKPDGKNLNSCIIDLIMPVAWWIRRTHDQYSHNNGKSPLKFHRIKTKRPKSLVRLFYSIAWPQDHADPLICPGGEPAPMDARPVDGAKMEKSWTSTGRHVELLDDDSSTSLSNEPHHPNAHWSTLSLDRTLHVSLPTSTKIDNPRPYHPGDVFAVILSFDHSPGAADDEAAPYLFSFKCQTVGNVRILGSETAPDSDWTTSTEMTYKQSALTIMAFYRGHFMLNESYSGEIVTVLLQIMPESSRIYESKERKSPSNNNNNNTSSIISTAHPEPTVIFTLQYSNDYPKSNPAITTSSSTSTPAAQEIMTKLDEKNQSTFESFGKLLEETATTQNQDSMPPIVKQYTFRVEKDSVLTLVPIGKFDFVNTAILSGSQIAMSLKIFSLTYASTVADVTTQTRCVSREISVIKVTPGCTSVYVDGSESRSDPNAMIDVNFGQVHTTINYNVWYPEFPIEIQLSDPVLHAIKNWRVDDKPNDRIWNRKKRNGSVLASNLLKPIPKLYPKRTCRLKYQESEVKVYARFKVDDLNTGGRSFLGGRRFLYDVTTICKSHLKLTNQNVARLREASDGTLYVQGLYPGRTEIKLVSSYANAEFASAFLEVSNDMVMVRQLKAESISSVGMSIEADATNADVYHIFVEKSAVFTEKYQTGRINMDVEFSNGAHMPLHHINGGEYTLELVTRDDSLALRDKENLPTARDYNYDAKESDKHILKTQQDHLFFKDDHQQRSTTLILTGTERPPSFLALKETRGNNIFVSVFSSPSCYRHHVDQPLASASVFIEVFFGKEKRHEKKDVAGKRKLDQNNPFPAIEAFKGMQKNGKIKTNSRIWSDEQNFKRKIAKDAAVLRNGNDPAKSSKKSDNSKGVTTVEVAMYIFLALFATVGAAFALHCFAVNGSVITAATPTGARRRRNAPHRRSVIISAAALKHPAAALLDGWLLRPWRRLADFAWRNAGTASSARREFVWLGPDDLHDSLRLSSSMYNASSVRRPLSNEDFCGRESLIPNGHTPFGMTYTGDNDADWIDNDDDLEEILQGNNPIPKIDFSKAQPTMLGLKPVGNLATPIPPPGAELQSETKPSITDVSTSIDDSAPTPSEDIDITYGASTYPGRSRRQDVLAPLRTSVNSGNANINNGKANKPANGVGSSQTDETNSISYLGSEISIIMNTGVTAGRNRATLEVHDKNAKASSWDPNDRRGSRRENAKCDLNSADESTISARPNTISHTWSAMFRSRKPKEPNGGGDGGSPQLRVTANPLSAGGGLTRSSRDLHWDSTSLGLNESQLRDYFNSLRESMA